jgi:hypothetical protein
MKDILDGPDDPNLEVSVRTLTLGGFVLEGAERNPGYALLHMKREDEFGIEHNYSFAIFENDPTPGQVDAANIATTHRESKLVIISPNFCSNNSFIAWNRFVNIFGGPVISSSVLEPEFPNELILLGKNKLPDNLTGKADDLFEIYVRNALEFLFNCRVVRYGQNRRFEARSDGIIIQSKDFTALYDAKAYSDGYDVTENSIRQFKSYTEEFKRRYFQFFELNTFLVISGSFIQKKKTLEKRSREMQAEAGVPLSFISADVLADVVKLLSGFPLARRSINWRKVFANPVLEEGQIEKELEVIRKDQIISEHGRK